MSIESSSQTARYSESENESALMIESGCNSVVCGSKREREKERERERERERDGEREREREKEREIKEERWIEQHKPGRGRRG